MHNCAAVSRAIWRDYIGNIFADHERDAAVWQDRPQFSRPGRRNTYDLITITMIDSWVARPPVLYVQRELRFTHLKR